MRVKKQGLERRDIGSLSFFVRPGSVDEDVLTVAYQEPRFFAPSYVPGKADTILDVGAHIGVFTIKAAHRVPEGCVYAIEPASDNFEILQLNVAANGMSNVQTRRLALAQASGQVTLWMGTGSWGYSICSAPPGGESDDLELVEARSLEEFLATENILHVDYMKMNVEGAEYEILLSTRPHSLRIIASMLVEYHPNDDHSGEELDDWLRMCGYTTHHVPSVGEAAKGWITAQLGR
jgi:FkbM family methyltransferase